MKYYLIIFILALSTIPMFLPIEGLSIAGRRTLSVFVFAALCWITEIIPVSATGGIVVALLALLVPPVESSLSYTTIISSFASPVIMLFAGGYFLAAAMQKYNMDTLFANRILKHTGKSPYAVIIGIMIVTAFLSMWMSNTAATTLMIAVVLPIVKDLKDDPSAKAMLLSVPFAANVGGIATPIGTPPNAIAIQSLAEAGINISFIKWFSFGFPVTLVMLVIIYFLLRLVFPAKSNRIDLKIKSSEIGPKQKIVLLVLILTALLWFTTGIHGIPAALVAMLPPIVFLGSGLMNRNDLRMIGWDILIMIAGGIALGIAMRASGLSSWLLYAFHMDNMQPWMLIGIFGLLSLTLSSFMSHTAATTIIVPIGIAVGNIVGALVVMVALISSCSMIFPVSTPPNAIAYGSGLIRQKDMVRAGLVIATLSLFLNYGIVRLFFG